MKNTELKTAVVSLAVMVIMAIGASVPAQEAEGMENDLPPGMTAEDMATWQQAITPGPEHARLAAMAGSWTFQGTFWMAPDAPPMESTGTAERTMILGGRVLVEKVKSEFQGEAFEGIAMTGFDNVSGTYWGTWADNMSTGLMVSTGTCTDGGCEFTGTYNDPIIGGAKIVRVVMTAEPDREVHQSFEQGPAGEFMAMQLVYTRTK